MSYRFSQLSPQVSTNGRSVRFAVRGPWSDPPEKFGDVQFLRSWFEFNSEDGEECRPHRVNWNAILGLALVAAISAAFWTGVGFLTAHFLR